MGNEISKKLKKQIKEEKEENQKILFIGTADSGKSTLFNHIKLIEHPIVIDSDSIQYNAILHRFCYILIDFLNLFDNDLRCQENSYQFLRDIVKNKISIGELYNENKGLFTKENLITKFKEKINSFDSEDNVEYLLNNLERILIKKESITELDYLSSFSRTFGIEEYNTLQNNVINTFGGQRFERRKWVQSIDSVSTLVMFISLSDFNQVCYEDEERNRLKESLWLFNQLFDVYNFKYNNFLLVFTKIDCFINKINSGIKMSAYFNEFNGNDDNPKEVFEFILNKFSKIYIKQFKTLKGKEKLKYCVLNCLDKSECIKVRDIIENLNRHKLQKDMFISNRLLSNDNRLKQMIIKLYQSIMNLNYCDIDINGLS